MSHAETPTRLNLGSGAACPPGWLHLDNSPGAWLGRHPGILRILRRLLGSRARAWLPAEGWGVNCLRADLSKGLPLPSASADHAYSSHFLEHLSREEGERLLADCARVLRPGGRLRLLVPDLGSIVERYERCRAERPAEAAKVFLEATGFLDYPFPRDPLRWPMWIVRRRHNHAFLYDEAALRAALQAAGFADIRRCGYGESDIPGIREVEVPDRFEHSLCLEATRPAERARRG
jgi:SAM-dependent methyltransferase